MATRKSSPWLRFAVFLVAFSLIFGLLWLIGSKETPPWREQTGATPREPAASTSRTDVPKGDDLAPFRFAIYNLKNWLSSDQNPTKSSASKNAIVKILAQSEADVIGLSEIGSEEDVLEIRKMLRQAGRDFPHYHHTGGVDPVRHLAILSRFPIVSTSQPEIELSHFPSSMQRGIIDASIHIGGRAVRFIGMHLKSKRVVPQFDHEHLRIAEAEHVRDHIDEILTHAPHAYLIAYGDWNDHPRSISTRALLGTYRSPLYLTPVHLKDSHGESWTYSYDYQDSYTRIDFIAVSDALKSRIDGKQSRIIDDPQWNLASDHRALPVSFK